MRAVVWKSSILSGQNKISEVDSILEGQLASLDPLVTQIGGHVGFLKLNKDKVLKPVQTAPKGVREKWFYENADFFFSKFIPIYFGTVELKFSDEVEPREYIVLQDVAKGYSKPTIMDIKIGTQTYGPDATPCKIMSENSKYLGTKKPLGLSLVSMFVYPILSDNRPAIYDRTFGKQLKTEEVFKVPKIFFDTQSGVDVKPLVRVVIKKLKEIGDMFENQRKYLLYSSSLLIAYDAEAFRQWLMNPESVNLYKSVNIKIIDFAHVFDANGKKDDNFLFGLWNLVALFEQLLQSATN